MIGRELRCGGIRLGDAMEVSTVVDVFCGVGGLTHGFVKEGFRVAAGLDSDAACRYPYEHNNGATFIHKRIEDVRPEQILNFYPAEHTKILVGCAPCQPFSTYTRNRPKGDKWKLLSAFADLIDGVAPDVVSMENVPQLVKFDGGSIFKEFVRRLKANYWVTWDLIYCPDYGIPQKRTRLVLFASRFGDIEISPKTHAPEHYRTVADAIGDLPAIRAGGVCAKDPLHRASGMSELNLRRIKSSRAGGTWLDWDQELVAACHKKETGKTYRGVYGRMNWDEPSPTITTQFHGFGNGRFGHPEQDRALSVREAALLQTFPHNYEFVEPDTPYYMAVLGRQIGNAVPVDLGRVIARSIKRHLEQRRAP